MLLLQAWIQLQYGHPERSRILLEALLALQTDCVAAQRILIVALLQSGRGAEARIQCEALLSHTALTPGEKHPALWLCLSHAHQISGDPAGTRWVKRQFLGQQTHGRFCRRAGIAAANAQDS